MTASFVETTGLTKIFRDFWQRTKVPAVTELDLSVKPGEIFGLLGPNGSGKSTTMRLLLGLLHPTSGQVTILGKSPRHVATRKRIGYLPEESQLYEQLTAEETLRFYGGLFGLRRNDVQERSEALLDMVGLAHAADRPVGEFSRGMARRIGLAQALINDPDLLILDEPTAGLDPIGCRQIKDLLRALAERGKTILLSSHLLADVQDVCDRIALLHNGRRLTEGCMSELLACRDRVRFSVDGLTPEQVTQVKRAIQDVCGEAPDVDSPTRPLETFFIESIASATNATNEQPPSGVSQSTRLAPFLGAAQ